MKRLTIAAAALVAAFVLAPATALAAKGDYRAEIRRTTGGVPHIKARDYGSLGFGTGHAYAQDQICEMASIITTVKAQRSRFFGPDGDSPSGGTNLQSDFFWQRIADMRTVERLSRRKAPHGPARDVRQNIRGFVAGYNAYLRRTGRSKLPDPTCRGKAWVRPITVMDVYRRFYQLGLRASSGNFLEEIVAAAPPTAASGRAAALPSVEELRARLADDPVLGDATSHGSNAYGIGSRGTRAGTRAVVLGNPHFPWQGPERWYELHLTIPGEIDAIGAGLQGAPVVNIGFNKDVAFSHTVSTARRFTPYELKLKAGSPTTYLVNGREQRMRRRTVAVRFRGQVRRHTFYETRWGPVISFPAATLSWTTETAYALADVNADNFRLTNQWSQYDRAKSVAGLRRASARVQGNPWVNVIAADRRGRAYYADDSVVPNVDAAKMRSCANLPKSDLLLSAGGVVLLDGSRSACAWGNDRDAVAKGILGPRALPRVTRRDYVENSNDSYWIPNADVRLTGFPPIIGPERTPRLLRGRLGLLQAEQRLAGTDGLGPQGFDLGTMQGVFNANRNLSGELARGAVVTACTARGGPDLAEACAALAGWDGQGNTTSTGAVLWRETWSRLASAGAPWLVPFDPADPVNTPRDLDPSSDAILVALREAVGDLREKGIPLAAPLGDWQSEPRGSERIPIPGCTEGEGCFNIITTDRDAAGRYDPRTGSSFVMTMAFDSRGRPRGESVLSYSQSENPRSRHYADQTRLFSREGWKPMRFTERQIKSDPAYTRRVVTGSR
jgi:acyl-homoserine-lactone acylase